MQCHSWLILLSLGQGFETTKGACAAFAGRGGSLTGSSHWERRSATGPVAMIPHCCGEGEFECLLGLGEGLSGF